MIEQIKKLRVEIDGLAQLANSMKLEKVTATSNNYDTRIIELINSKQIEKATDSLLLAKAWLDKVLEELSTPTNTYAVKKDVIATQEVTTNESEYVQLHHNIYKIIGLQNEIELVIDKLPDWREYIAKLVEDAIDKAETKEDIENATDNLPSVDLIDYVYQHLQEAKFWLGFELERIKKED